MEGATGVTALPRTHNAVVAMAGAISLGMLAGATIPTQIKSPFGSDWRDLYSPRGDPATPTFYVEAGPEDLSPTGPDYAMADRRPTWVRAEQARNEREAERVTAWEDSWQAPEPATIIEASTPVTLPAAAPAPLVAAPPPPAGNAADASAVVGDDPAAPRQVAIVL